MSTSDAKLVHLVRKFVSLSADTAPNADHIVHCLRTQHREYQRKDFARLKRQVQKALKRIFRERSVQNEAAAAAAAGAMGPAAAAEHGKKRSIEQAVEEQYDKKARKHDLERSLRLDDGSALNDGLRDRYRKLQQERAQAGNAQPEPAPSDLTVEEHPNIVSNSGSTSSQEQQQQAQQQTQQQTHPYCSTDTANGKRRKREDDRNGLRLSPQPDGRSSSKSSRRKKSSSSKRTSLSSIEAFGATAGNHNDNDTGFSTPVSRPTERYADLGGMQDILQQIRQLVEYPLVRPEVYRYLGVDPPRGVLLRGPPGCGKTHLANAIAGQLGVPYFRVSAPELVSGMSGESEGRIRDLFRAASLSAPAIVFMDELDAIAPKRTDGASGRGMEKRMVAQLLTSMDSIDPKYNKNNACVTVIAATNRPDSIDPALRRAGRFDKEILLGVPDEQARLSIIKTMTKNMRLAGDFDYKILARKTPGYVGADLRSLTKEAAVIAINRIFQNVLRDQALVGIAATAKNEDTKDNGNHNRNSIDNGASDNSATTASVTPSNNSNDDTNDATTVNTVQPTETQVGISAQPPSPSATYDISSVVPFTAQQLEPLDIGMSDFLEAIPHVQPSSKREGFATVPDVSWEDIGALGSIRDELVLSVLEPIRNPEKFQALGIPLPAGVMLYGPPGCGKTLLAKAIANESGANFISVKGPELLDKYVGESERAVRIVFERARSSSPCVVFFDELDSLCPRRGSDGGGGGGVSERVVNQLLTEMDGLESRRSVFVIAATNRPELIDPAMMRPGRLDKLLYVPLPTPKDRVSILTALAKNVKLSPDVDLTAIGTSQRAEGYSGADCAALLREAGLAVVKEGLVGSSSSTADANDSIDTTTLCISNEHFQYAFNHVMPSVSKKDQARYDRLRDRMARARSRGAVSPVDDDGAATESPTDNNNNNGGTSDPATAVEVTAVTADASAVAHGSAIYTDVKPKIEDGTQHGYVGKSSEDQEIDRSTKSGHEARNGSAA